MYLFENEFQVPLLSPLLAAYSATFIELVFSSLVVLGLGSRFAAFVLFMFNFIAVISYPDLGANGLRDHQVWGLMLLITLFYGPGKLALDTLLQRQLLRWRETR